MEKAGSLINRLLEQYQQKIPPEKMLITVHMLMTELQRMQPQQDNAPQKKVVVILPSEPLHLPVDVKNGEDLVPKSIPSEPAQNRAKEITVKPEIDSVNAGILNGFDPMRDIPTLAHQRKEGFEINEALRGSKESINEKLKESNKEVSAALHEAPVRDLRKAIGINDRYLFISELFRGDEVMYERSIKTINSFSILPEAEYWIMRELKTKLGWNDISETVQHFDQLVRRRFS